MHTSILMCLETGNCSGQHQACMRSWSRNSKVLSSRKTTDYMHEIDYEYYPNLIKYDMHKYKYNYKHANLKLKEPFNQN